MLDDVTISVGRYTKLFNVYFIIYVLVTSSLLRQANLVTNLIGMKSYTWWNTDQNKLVFNFPQSALK